MVKIALSLEAKRNNFNIENIAVHSDYTSTTIEQASCYAIPTAK